MSLLSNATSVPNNLSPRQTDRQTPTIGGFFDDSILFAVSQVTDSRIRMTIEYIRTNLHLTLSIAVIARTVNLSESRLRCLFSEVTELRWSRFNGHGTLLAKSSNLYEKNICKIYCQQDHQNTSQV